MSVNPRRPHTPRTATAVGTSLLLALSLTNCATANGPTPSETTQTTAGASSSSPLPPEREEMRASDFGSTWHLSVDHGMASCEISAKGDPIARFTVPDGAVYAVNSVNENQGLPRIEEISRGSVGPLRSRVLGLCSR